MKIQSAKNKGRRLQQWVVSRILNRCPQLTKDDVRSTPMGVAGADVQLSAHAQQCFPYAVECKNCEKISPYEWYRQASSRCNGDLEPVVIFKKNGEKPLALIDAEWFIQAGAYDE